MSDQNVKVRSNAQPGQNQSTTLVTPTSESNQNLISSKKSARVVSFCCSSISNFNVSNINLQTFKTQKKQCFNRRCNFPNSQQSQFFYELWPWINFIETRRKSWSNKKRRHNLTFLGLWLSICAKFLLCNLYLWFCIHKSWHYWIILG